MLFITRWYARLRGFALTLLVAGVLSACAAPSYKPALPEKLGNEGVVVGQITDLGTFKGFVMGVFLTNGKEIGITNGYFAASLPPGSYEVKTVYTETLGVAGSRVLGHYPLNLAFTIREKEVTNLGVVVIAPRGGGTPAKPAFQMVRVDNSSDIPPFFRRFYPELAPFLALDRVQLAEGTYLDAKQLAALRRDIVTRSYETRNRPANAAGSSRVVSDVLGTLAEVKYDASNQIADIRLFDTGTFASLAMRAVDPFTNRHVITAANQRALMVENGKLTELTLPAASLRRPYVYPVGKTGLVVTDVECELYTSLDNGATWKHHGELKREKEKCDRYSAAPGEKGYYLYFPNWSVMDTYPAIVQYSPNGQRTFQTLPVPPEVKQLEWVQEYAGKLYIRSHRLHDKISPETGKKQNAQAFFVRGLDDAVWKQVFLPTFSCGRLAFEDSKGDQIRIRCSDEQYVSKDGGATWQPVW